MDPSIQTHHFVSSTADEDVSIWILSVLLLLPSSLLSFARQPNQPWFCPLGLNRRLNEPYHKQGLIYFADIIKLKGKYVCEKAHEYKAQFEGMSYEDIIEDLTYRINDIANVVHEKYMCVGEAVRQSITTFYLWAISIILLIMMNMM